MGTSRAGRCMIAADQPHCFPSTLRAAVSSREDGSMLDRSLADRHDVRVLARRLAFCEQAGIDYAAVVYQIISYSAECTYDTIVSVDAPDMQGRNADALYTETPGVGLFLPVADCVATIVYDSERRALALAHLGRHASVAKLMQKLIDVMKGKGTDPNNLTVWMAPNVAQTSYFMEYFDSANDPDWVDYVRRADNGFYLDLAGFNAGLARKAGVPAGAIFSSAIDTATNPQYFSHSQGDTSGRFAVVAIMEE